MSFIVKKDATEGFKEAKSSTSVEQVGEVLLDRIDRHQALSSHAIYQPDNSIKKINFLKINEGHLGICTRSKRIFINCLWVSITFLIVIQTLFHLESQRAGDQNLIKDFSWSNSF